MLHGDFIGHLNGWSSKAFNGVLTFLNQITGDVIQPMSCCIGVTSQIIQTIPPCHIIPRGKWGLADKVANALAIGIIDHQRDIGWFFQLKSDGNGRIGFVLLPRFENRVS